MNNYSRYGFFLLWLIIFPTMGLTQALTPQQQAFQNEENREDQREEQQNQEDQQKQQQQTANFEAQEQQQQAELSQGAQPGVNLNNGNYNPGAAVSNHPVIKNHKAAHSGDKKDGEK